MISINKIFLLALLPFLLLIQGCGGKSEVASITKEPKDFYLYTSKPEEFEFDLSDDGNYTFVIDLTYDRLQLKEFKTLNMYYMLVWPDKHETEKVFDYVIHDGEKYLGTAKDPESKVDYMLSKEIHTGIQLKKGHYKFRLFANRENKKDIPGMVTIVFKVLKG